MAIFDTIRKVRNLEILCETLSLENDQLRSSQDELKKRLEQRIANVESALNRVLEMFRHTWAGPQEQLTMRTCTAILEDESWKR